VAEILAQAEAEQWPTSSLSPRRQVDDRPTEPISLVRPYCAPEAWKVSAPPSADEPANF
jgi:hypothetical protein